MRKAWIIISVVCILVAGVALWTEHTDIAFVAGTLGAVAWFLNYRVGLRESLPQTNLSDDEELEETNEI